VFTLDQKLVFVLEKANEIRLELFPFLNASAAQRAEKQSWRKSRAIVFCKVVYSRSEVGFCVGKRERNTIRTVSISQTPSNRPAKNYLEGKSRAIVFLSRPASFQCFLDV